ncbi:MAG: response regulator, partial [Rubrivivax sp.]|nr:response regulator [Rubrivivax sp.]
LPARWDSPHGVRHLRISGEPNIGPGNRFIGYWGVARDVTDEWEAQQALVQSRALLATVFDLSPDVITLTEMDTGRFERVNQRFSEVFGVDAELARGQSADGLGLWAEASGRERLAASVQAQGTVRDLPLRYRLADGSAATMLVSARRFERDGRQWLIGIARDVTREAWDRRERDAMLSHAPVGLVFTRDGFVRKANAEAERLFGAAPGGLAGLTLASLIADPTQAPALRERQFTLFDAGQPLALDLELRRVDRAEVFTAMVRASPLDEAHPRDGTVWIVQDITERRRMESALAAARDQAEAANRAKSTFLANTSHEIRTPLHGLLGLAQLARQPGVDDTRRGQYLDQIADSAQNLSAIISDILDLSKIEAGKLQVEFVAFDLHELLQSLHRAYAALADAQDLRCGLHLAPGLPQQVGGDPLRLRQVLSNFLNNALKFTAAGGVDIEAVPLAGGRVRITVADTGPGIGAEAQARLFRPFTQADESTTRRFGGTGLGLSICRELAVLMGGEVGLDSRLGEGSRFHVELPLPEQQPDDPASGFGALDTGRLTGARVLLVEDNAVNTLIAVAMLEQWGVRVTSADSGEEALAAVDAAAARGVAFDAVLMDLQMPGMSGYDTTLALRERFGPEAMPVIALTAAALVSEREAARAAGMTDFVTKPIDAERLRRALLQALNG